MMKAIRNSSNSINSEKKLQNLFSRKQAERWVSTRLRVCIPKNYQQDPILSRLTYDFGILVNITSAMLGPNTGGQGWFDLELRGTIAQIKSALAYLHSLEMKIWNIASAETEERSRHGEFDWGGGLYSEKELRRALKHGELQVHYQPIVSLTTGQIEGFEALTRWIHPEHGLVPPAKFMPIAEVTGLVTCIDSRAIAIACRQLRIWQAEFPALTMSANVSGQQFLQPNLIGEISQALRESGIEPSSLKLEITETAIAAATEESAERAMQVKALGVKLAIDDFGTGYSSLSRLYSLPVDVLKIDRSFVSRIASDAKDSEIVQMMVQLARNLGLKVTAEGIETKQQLAALRSLGCDCGQGFLFSKPLDSQAAGKALASAPQW